MIHICNPAYIQAGVMLIQVAAQAYTTYEQREGAEAQEKYQSRSAEAQKAAVEQNYALAKASASEQSKALQARLVQEGEATVSETRQAQIEGARARATARVAAGEAGVSGLSVDALMRDFFSQEATYRDALRTNYGFTSEQIESEMKGVHSQAEGRVQSVRPYMKQPVSKPSYLTAALNIGGNALSTYERMNRKRPTSPSWT